MPSTAGAHDNVHTYVRDQLQIDLNITYWNVQSNYDTTVLTMLGDPVVGTGHCSRGLRSPADDLGGSGRSFVSLCGLLAGCGSRSSTSKDESAGTGKRSLAPSRCRASFRSVLGDSLTDMWTIIAMAVATAVVIIAFYRPLLFTTFDPEVADVSGVNTARIDALLMLLLTFAILASMKVLGVTLIAAALVIPPHRRPTAQQLVQTDADHLHLHRSSLRLVGLYLSYHPDISSGATIVLVNFVLFAVAYAYSAAKSTSHRPLATLKFARRADIDPVANSSVVLPAEITLDTPQQ